MKRGQYESETLKLNGWGIGDILEGYSLQHPTMTVLRCIVTGIGEDLVLVRFYVDTIWGEETTLKLLPNRAWRKIGRAQ